MLGDLIRDWVLTISWSRMYKAGLNARLNMLKGMDILHEIINFFIHISGKLGKEYTHTYTQNLHWEFLNVIFSPARKHIFCFKIHYYKGLFIHSYIQKINWHGTCWAWKRDQGRLHPKATTELVKVHWHILAEYRWDETVRKMRQEGLGRNVG